MLVIHCTYITHFFKFLIILYLQGQVVGQIDRQINRDKGISLALFPIFPWIYKNSKCIDRKSVEENLKK